MSQNLSSWEFFLNNRENRKAWGLTNIMNPNMLCSSHYIRPIWWVPHRQVEPTTIGRRAADEHAARLVANPAANII